MSTFRLILRSLFHYWRTNLAVLLGVVAGTAVIGGALIVGDSVRGSLRQMTLDRLGDIDHVLASHRFFREDLADELAADPQFQEQFTAAAPVLAITGSLKHSDEAAGSESDTSIHRASNLNVYGVDERMWTLTEHGQVAVPEGDQIVLNSRTAGQLQAVAGDVVTMSVELPSTIPRDSLLGKRDQETVEFPLTVAAVLPEESGAGRFETNPNQQLPLVCYVALDTLQRNMGLGAETIRDRVRRQIIERPARVNSIFVHTRDRSDATGDQAEEATSTLTDLVEQHLTLDDLYLRTVRNEDRGYISLESEQQILGYDLAASARTAASRLNLHSSEVLVYLANEIRPVERKNTPGTGDEDAPPGYSMYSVIAGIEPVQPSSPFGPFEFIGDVPAQPLETTTEGEGGVPGIVLNEWLAADLQVGVGDRVRVTYHIVGAELLAEDGRLPETHRDFEIRGIVAMSGPAEDAGFTPQVRGITDAKTFGEWDAPFPMKTDLITDRDEEYWDQYKATPKAFIGLGTAQNLWESRYGQLTSFRVAPAEGATLEQTETDFRAALLKEFGPQELALAFQPVKYQGLEAASGTTDFSGLFLGFSFFIILSAMILIGLLFRLGIEQRSTGIGLLGALGFSPRGVRRLFLTEGTVVVLLGALLGVAAAIGYAEVMVYGLKTWWFGAIGTRFLEVHLTPLSLILGFVISVVVAVLAIAWALRQLRGLSTRDLLAGTTEKSLSVEAQRRRSRSGLQIGLGLLVLAGVLVVLTILDVIPATEAFEGFSWQTVSFFVVGTSLLAASLCLLSGWLDRDRSSSAIGTGSGGVNRLGLRNAARHRQRSVLTTGLIASATFVIIAVAAGQRNPAVETPDKNSGNGGFVLVAESSTPVLYNLNSADGRAEMGLDFPQMRNVEGTDRRVALMGASFLPFRVNPGENASCLNIYQTQLPTVLGVPLHDREVGPGEVSPGIIDRGGFKFIGADRDNPWTLLAEDLPLVEVEDKDSVPAYPVIGDNNTLQYSLHKAVGDLIPVPDENNTEYFLKIVGRLDGSVFQGVLVMSEENFLKLYPERKGYQYFLIENHLQEFAGSTEKLATILESGLEDYGFDTERVSDRLADFLAVQNTYLSTFQTLGGLGLLLGTLGLATVMLRNVLERRAELALLRAVGFRNTGLTRLVLLENAFLLLWGLTAGTVSALLAMLPHLLSTGADVPWAANGLLLLAVFAIGMTAAVVAVLEAVRTPIVATLRAE